jgi:hypothetical protein
MFAKMACAMLLSFMVIGCSKKQEVIFEAQSISYKGGNSAWKPEIQKECSEMSKELKTFINDGWKVVASSPKEKVVAADKGTCIGTEYIIEK